MQWIIPMAGKGSRTRSLGEFKPFINISGQKMFSWFISSIKHLVRPEDSFLLITLEENFIKYDFEPVTRRIIISHGLGNEVKYFTVPGAPHGTSDTVYLARNLILKDERVIVIYPDQYIDFELPKMVDDCAYLGIYIQLGNKSGFVKLQDGKITQFVEKTNISNIASSGFYIVPKGSDLIYGIERQLESGETLNGEYYLGPIFNFLIQRGMCVFPIGVKAKYDLGNPEDIAYFANFISRSTFLTEAK